MKFHHKERKMDMVRRRRWHRKMVCEQPTAPCVFSIPDTDEKEDEKYALAMTAPRMFLTCESEC
jgi:dysferlin